MEGNAYTFGRNERGQLGDKSYEASNRPIKIAIPECVVKAAVGRNHTVLLTESGKLYAAGDNKCKQLGFREEKDYMEFAPISLMSEHKVVDVSCGVDFTIALTGRNILESYRI